MKKRTKKELHREAARDLGVKLFCERILIRKLQPHFRKIANKFARVYAKTGEIIGLKDHKDFFEKTISENYKLVAQRFDRSLRDHIGDPINNKEINKRIKSSIEHKASQRAHKYSEGIARTTKDSLHRSVNRAIAEAIAAGSAISHVETAKQAKRIIDERFSRRIPNIAMTEVQAAAEGGKGIELTEMRAGNARYKIKRNKKGLEIKRNEDPRYDRTYDPTWGRTEEEEEDARAERAAPKDEGSKPFFENEGSETELTETAEEAIQYGEEAYFHFNDIDVTKTWIAILDDHTREWHAEADGQEVPVNEPFEVNGEQLMHPGDDSLGASAENLNNCRCSSISSLGETIEAE